MPANPNKLSQFWQELKRRNVTRVLAVYIAAAFMILELISMFSEQIGLPNGTWKVAFIISLAGLLIAVIVSWVYDIQPEEGIVKTEPTTGSAEDIAPPSSKSWKIASYISFIVIVGLIVLNIIPRTGKKEILEKSIAVLPFINDSPDEANQHVIDGYMTAITNNLCRIKDLKVIGRSSVERYRNHVEPIPEIAEELNVNYLLNAFGQKYGNNIVLTVQLLDASEQIIWSSPYDRRISSVNDHISLQSEIAQLVADELQAIITPKEEQHITLIPTNSLDAYDYYLLGQQYINNFSQVEDFWRAIQHFQQSIELDSNFALAYSGIADAYCQLADFAILSPNVAYPKAKEYAMKAVELNDELGFTHCILGRIKEYFDYDFKGAEKEYIRALAINSRSSTIHEYYSFYLSLVGRHDEAVSHADFALDLDPLSFFSKTVKYFALFYAGSKSEALELAEQARDAYPDSPFYYWMCALFYTDLGMLNEALATLQTQLTLMENDNISDEVGLLGYLYGQLGQKDKAEEQFTRLDELSSKGFYVSPRTEVWIHLGLNNIEKAVVILEQALDDHTIDPFMIRIYPNENLRENPRFNELLKRIGIIV